MTLDGLERFFQSLHGVWGYLFLFVSSLCENLFPPLPGDTFVVLGAFLVGRGQLSALPAFVSATAGSLSGFMILFAVGATWGRRFVRSRGQRLFPEEHLLRVEQWFDRWGYAVIAGNRFLSGFRGVVSLAAGMARMDARRVFLLALISCLVWNAILMTAGVWAGENWPVLLRHYQFAIFILITVILIGFIVRMLIRKRSRRNEEM